MAKGKRKVIDSTNTIGIFSLLQSPKEKEDTSKKKKKEENKSSIQTIELTANGKLPPDILEERFRNRTIPKVDDGFNTDNNLSPEALQKFYKTHHVNEYVKSINGGKFIRFEFGSALKGYAVNLDENDENPTIHKLTYAEISKKSFINNMNLTVRYINYFIQFYDDDDELLTAYLSLMAAMHMEKSEYPVENFINQIYSWLASPSMVQKVARMVEYNIDDTLIKKSDRQYDESIQLTPSHLRGIMGTSIFTRFAIPIVSHYYAIRRKEVEAAGLSDKDLYFLVFQNFTPLFDDIYDIKLYEKLYHTATTRISKTENRENAMWGRRARFGKTPTSYTHELMRDFINDIVQKVIFTKSAIIFMHVCFDKSIKNELLAPDKHEMSDMKMEPSDSVNESISRFDRWQMDRCQFSERDRLRAYASIKDMVRSHGEKFGLSFLSIPDMKNPNIVSYDKDTQEEFEFYRENIKKPLYDTQLYLIQLYCSSVLGSSEDVKMMEFEDIIKMIMIMKRDLRARNFNYIPYFISSEIVASSVKKHNPKTIGNVFRAMPIYADWEEEFKDTKDHFNESRFFGELNNMISCPINIVEYDDQLNEKRVTPNEVPVIDEWGRFMLDI